MTVTVGPWATGVVAAPTQDPPANAAGWNGTDVVVTWNWSHSGAGIDPADCPPATTSTGEGALVINATCTDRAGVTGTAAYPLNVDKTPPVVSIDTHPADPDDTGSAAFTFAVGDPGGSGLAAVGCMLDAGPATPCDSPGTQAYTGLAVGPHTFTVSATDLAGNPGQATVAWSVVDTTPPVIAPHDDETVEATGPAGALVTYAPPATSDAVDGAGVATCAPALGGAFALGDTTVLCDAVDVAGNHAVQARFTVTVVDTTGPEFTAPADLTVPATSPAGAVVTWTTPTATDAVDGTDAVTCLPAPGSTFPLGSTTVTCTSTDAAHNTTTHPFTTTVVGSGPVAAPTQAPAANGDGWNGTDVVVTWHWTSTEAAIDPARCTTSSTSSGEGTLTLTATCANVAGATGSASYTVKVDKTKPGVAITGHPASQSGSSSAAFTFSATDPGGSGVATVACRLDAGPTTPCQTGTSQAYDGLAHGSHTFTVIATDMAGNSSQKTFSWCVSAHGPSISVTHVADGSNGWNRSSPVGLVITVTAGTKPVTLAPTCTENGHALTVTGSASPYGASVSGSGSHAITCKATDSAGASATGTDTVRIDTKAPTVTVPANIVVDAPSAVGVVVRYTASFADATSGLATKACSPATATTFPVGTTTVTCTATDKAGNKASSSFTVRVRLRTARECKEAVLASLTRELASTRDAKARSRLSDAIGHLGDGLAPELWVAGGPLADDNHLDAVSGDRAFDADRAAVDALMGIRRPSNRVKAAIADIESADRAIAQAAIDGAVAATRAIARA